MKFEPLGKKDGRFVWDVKDKKILSIISSNARTPYTKISKNVGLSSDAVSYRINNYEKAGVIQGWRSIINISKFGYENYHLFLSLNKPASAVQDSIVKSLLKLDFVRTIVSYNGSFDLELAITTKGPDNFDKCLKEIISICGLNLLSYNILMVTKKYRSGALPNSMISSDINRKFVSYKVDHYDFSIMKILANDSKISAVNIASKIGLSADAVVYRLKKLYSSGFILGYVPAFNYDKFNLQVYAVLMNINSSSIDYDKKLSNFLLSDPNVLWAVRTIGNYNLLMYLTSSNNRDVHQTIHNLRNLFPGMIAKFELLLAEEEHKYSYYPEILDKEKF